MRQSTAQSNEEAQLVQLRVKFASGTIEELQEFQRKLQKVVDEQKVAFTKMESERTSMRSSFEFRQFEREYENYVLYGKATVKKVNDIIASMSSYRSTEKPSNRQEKNVFEKYEQYEAQHKKAKNVYLSNVHQLRLLKHYIQERMDYPEALPPKGEGAMPASVLLGEILNVKQSTHRKKLIDLYGRGGFLSALVYACQKGLLEIARSLLLKKAALHIDLRRLRGGVDDLLEYVRSSSANATTRQQMEALVQQHAAIQVADGRVVKASEEVELMSSVDDIDNQGLRLQPQDIIRDIDLYCRRLKRWQAEVNTCQRNSKQNLDSYGDYLIKLQSELRGHLDILKVHQQKLLVAPFTRDEYANDIAKIDIEGHILTTQCYIDVIQVEYYLHLQFEAASRQEAPNYPASISAQFDELRSKADNPNYRPSIYQLLQICDEPSLLIFAALQNSSIFRLTKLRQQIETGVWIIGHRKIDINSFIEPRYRYAEHVISRIDAEIARREQMNADEMAQQQRQQIASVKADIEAVLADALDTDNRQPYQLGYGKSKYHVTYNGVRLFVPHTIRDAYAISQEPTVDNEAAADVHARLAQRLVDGVKHKNGTQRFFRRVFGRHQALPTLQIYDSLSKKL